MAKKVDFVRWVIDQLSLRRPVVMGGKGDYWVDIKGMRHDPPKGKLLLDCSGLVTYGKYVLSDVDVRDTHNAQVLWKKSDPTDKPEPGDLGFYGRNGDSVEHVVVYLHGGHVASADGATNRRRTIEELPAILADELCRVRFHASEHYRHDRPFLGWRRNPLFAE